MNEEERRRGNHTASISKGFNPLMPSVSIWVQLQNILCQTGLCRTERQSAQMSKITNDGLTWFGTRCFTAVPIGQHLHCIFSGESVCVGILTIVMIRY